MANDQDKTETNGSPAATPRLRLRTRIAKMLKRHWLVLFAIVVIGGPLAVAFWPVGSVPPASSPSNAVHAVTAKDIAVYQGIMADYASTGDRCYYDTNTVLASDISGEILQDESTAIGYPGKWPGSDLNPFQYDKDLRTFRAQVARVEWLEAALNARNETSVTIPQFAVPPATGPHAVGNSMSFSFSLPAYTDDDQTALVYCNGALTGVYLDGTTWHTGPQPEMALERDSGPGWTGICNSN